MGGCLDAGVLDAAIHDSAAVRRAAAGSPGLAGRQQQELAGSPDRTIRAALAGNPNVAVNTLVGLAWDRADTVRVAVAGNPRTPDGSLHPLRTDPVPAVAAAARAAATARQHAPQPVRAAGDDELLGAIDLARDPAYRAILGQLAEKEARAERRAAARDVRQESADAPLVEWITEARAGSTTLDFAAWQAARAA